MPSIDQDVLDYIREHPGARRGDIVRAVAPELSDTTVWRSLSRLVDAGKLESSGRGRTTNYTLAGSAAVRAHLRTPGHRRPLVRHDPGFLDAYVPGLSFYLEDADRRMLAEAGSQVGQPVPAGTYARRILEQLLIDLSWASSRMEGNTYDILETEHLIRFGKAAEGKDRKDALMILNHKAAVQHVVDHLDEIGPTRRDILDIHSLLAEGLLGDPSMAGRLRATPVGISHSSYMPLNDAVAIDEEFDVLLEKARAIDDPFEQSFFLLVHIPYLQGFIDINKRTSRVASNIPLLKAGLAPMSFLTVDDETYIGGLIGVYELGNVALLREAFVDGYRRSARNYHVLQAEIDTPHKAALVHRDFVREAVRHSVLEAGAFRSDDILGMARARGIPEDDLEDVVAYCRQEFRGLHEGNLVRYRLRPEDLKGIDPG